jgi:D-3-phosphoglycerate dehydrogenase
MSTKPVILATTSSFAQSSPAAKKLLESRGYAVATNPHGRKLTEEELRELLAKHQPKGLLAGTEPVTSAALKGAAEYLKAVSRIGVGWDNVDRDAAYELGIPVSRTVGVLDQSVAELTLGMILTALRRTALSDRRIRSGNWKKETGFLLCGKTVGIVGFGAIGQCVARLCVAFGSQVVYSDVTNVSSVLGPQLALDELLHASDIVTLHASGSEKLLGARELDLLAKPGAIVVNTARGGMIDEAALAERLRNGRIDFACLDVFEREPYQGPLAELDNTLLTPHVGSYALEARIEMEIRAAENLLADLEG